MHRRILLSVVCLLLLATSAMAHDVFPDVQLEGKITQEQREYLGVPEGDFKISNINADFLFVEVFSMYCPICQRNAPSVNAMFADALASDKAGALRFLGIGAGNTPFEIAFYQKKFGVEFPLFEDPDYVAHKAVGGVGTPAYYLVDMREGKRSIVLFHEGEIKDKAAFLKDLLALIPE
ncbi:TlpA disulfide reductase family protein [Pseudodesulfovibrio indicus]|uniref:TlpA family protein disulfide reductase n=1 Tax=Pseudodesulfovibrio indicus TaxID=1716143 RepID=UPI002930CE5F|nr:TlpA disulfide reductase family protein [Pseudodesulfovibrio indicus]